MGLMSEILILPGNQLKVLLWGDDFLSTKNTGPGWMHETSARTWCSGRTWRERVGREVGGGIGMGKTCEPKAFSFQCMTKFTTKKKKKSSL